MEAENMVSRPTALVGMLFGVMFLATVDNQVLFLLLPTLQQHFSVPIEALGKLFSAYSLAASLFLLLAPLSDRWGRVLFLRFGLLGFGVVAFMTYHVDTYTQLFWLRTTTGLLAGLLSALTASLVGDLFPYSQRGRVMGVVLSSYFAAMILGVPVGAWIAEQWSWRIIFLISSGMAFFLSINGLIFFPKESSLGRTVTLRTYFGVYLRLLRQGETVGALAVSFAISGGTLAFLSFLSVYLDGTFGLSTSEIAWLFLVVGVASAIASPVSGWMSDRLGKRRIFLICNTLLVVPLMALTHLPWGILLTVGFFVISLSVVFRQTALHTLQTELVDSRERGSFMALRNSFSQLGISVSVFFAGYLYSNFGYEAVTVLAAFLTLLASGIFFWVINER